MTKTRLQKDLNAISQHYVEGNEFDTILTPYELMVIKQCLAGNNFLELGCSIGNSTIRLAKFAASIDVVEGSNENIELAKKKIKKIGKQNPVKIVFHNQLWEEFSFENPYSDIMWIRGIEHVKNPGNILKKMADSLKKTAGRLHLVTVNALSLNRRIGVFMGLLGDPHELSDRDIKFGHFKIYDKAQLINLLEQNGYRILRCEGIMLKPLPNSKMYELYKENPKLIDALGLMGKELPDYCTEVYICASPN